MKELENISPDQVKIVNERQVDYEKKFTGSTVRHKGHTFYEINCETGEISKAEYKEDKVVVVKERCLLTGAITGTTSVLRKEVECKENCLYIGALNKKSAGKKYVKWLFDRVNDNRQNK